MNITVLTYLAYLVISIALTAWVATTLYRSGSKYLQDALREDKALAESVNKLLVMGFYLINFGYITLNLKINVAVTDLQSALEILSGQIGLVLLVLGIVHFINMAIIQRIRRQRLMPAADQGAAGNRRYRTIVRPEPSRQQLSGIQAE